MASGQWSGSNRQSTLPSDWPTIRRRIIKRDRYCTWGSLAEDRSDGPCSWYAAEADHKGLNTDHSDENLRGLCKRHHGIRSGRQGGVASGTAAQKRVAARLRPKQRHPGLIYDD